MFNSCLLHIRVYYMGIYFYLMIAYILLLFVPGGKGRCRIYSYISSLFLSGLDPRCHHDIIHCKINYKIPPPPPHERTIWHYNRANTDAIQRSLKAFPWQQHFRLNDDVSWQVKSFTEIFLNIMSNLFLIMSKR